MENNSSIRDSHPVKGLLVKGFQRKYLRSRAHHLDPVVLVGKGGLSDAVLRKIDKSLEEHELIKVRFLEYTRDEIKAMCDGIETASRAICAGRVGHVGIFYRRHTDPGKRHIQIPEEQSHSIQS
ncbi:MAG TPA: YhbY family RNA-binding protein [bacterium]|nr:YhbY family RNA-binding protein [bacterium]